MRIIQNNEICGGIFINFDVDKDRERNIFLDYIWFGF